MLARLSVSDHSLMTCYESHTGRLEILYLGNDQEIVDWIKEANINVAFYDGDELPKDQTDSA